MAYVHVGKILAAQGIRGEVFIYLFAQEAAWSDRWKEVHLGPVGSEAPETSIKIKKLRPHQKQKKQGFVASLEGVNSRDLSEAMVGQNVFIPEEFLVSEEGENIYLREVLGFKVLDETRGAVGEVVGFSGNSMQDLLVIAHPSGETFEVPFVEPLLLEILNDEKCIKMDIPMGLVAGEEL